MKGVQNPAALLVKNGRPGLEQEDLQLWWHNILVPVWDTWHISQKFNGEILNVRKPKKTKTNSPHILSWLPNYACARTSQRKPRERIGKKKKGGGGRGKTQELTLTCNAVLNPHSDWSADDGRREVSKHNLCPGNWLTSKLFRHRATTRNQAKKLNLKLKTPAMTSVAKLQGAVIPQLKSIQVTKTKNNLELLQYSI